MRKVYELKKGMKIKVEEEIIELKEIEGEYAIFYTSYGEEIKYPDFFDIDEIGELIYTNIQRVEKNPTLF